MQISFTQLCQSLVDEFTVALTMIKRSHPSVKVRSVKLNIGQTEQDISAPKDNEEPNSLILTSRYPGSESGWRLEMELGERSEATFDGVKRPLVSRTAPMILDMFAWEPVTVIDGISSKWSSFLSVFDITQVIDLARIKESLLHQITVASNSLQVREFRQKALLLELPVPALSPSALGNKSLYGVLRSPLAEVQKSFNRPTTLAEMESLYEVLDILNVVIDNRKLRKIPLQQLIDI